MNTKPCFTEEQEVEMHARWITELLNACAARNRTAVTHDAIQEYCRLKKENLFNEAVLAGMREGQVNVMGVGKDASYELGDVATQDGKTL